MASFIIFYAQELGLLKETKIIQTMVKDLKQGLSRDVISVQLFFLIGFDEKGILLFIKIKAFNFFISDAHYFTEYSAKVP